MARFLLVHGSNHGAWCWRDVLPALTLAGHEARAIDLPSVSPDPAALTSVTLEDDARAICAALAGPTLSGPSASGPKLSGPTLSGPTVPDPTVSGPTVLVGHSAAGFAISRAAALAPQDVAALVYLCAYVPHPGATIAGLARAAPGRPLDGALEVDRVHRAYRFRPAALTANLYHDCPDDTVAFARARLGWQATRAQAETVAAPPPDISAHYITCTRDRTIPPAQQDEMADTLPDATRHEIDTGHSPFFAAPDLLADLLTAIAAAS